MMNFLDRCIDESMEAALGRLRPRRKRNGERYYEGTGRYFANPLAGLPEDDWEIF